MRYLKYLIYILLIIPSLTFGQDSFFTKGQKVEGLFWKYKPPVVTVKVGNEKVNLNSVDSVLFKSYDRSFLPTYRLLKDNGILVSFKDKPTILLNDEYSNNPTDINPEYINGKLLKFQTARNTGFVLQGVGFALATVGGFGDSNELIAIGGISGLIGWIIEWQSGTALKDKSRK